MSNGHVEIHDLFGNNNNLSEHKASSHEDDMQDTVEFRLIMAYDKRRKGNADSNGDSPAINEAANGSAPSHPPERTEEKEKMMKTKKKKKKKGWKHLPSIFRCVKPQTEDAEEADQVNIESCSDRIINHADEDKEEDALREVVSRLTEIIEDIPFIPPDIESDGQDGTNAQEVETMIALLLRETGDRIYEQELKDANITGELFWNYSFFRSLINAFLSRMGLRSPDPDAPGPHASPKTQIAVTCEVTSRLAALKTLPANRLLDHGARYLQDYYSPWVLQQGGYDAAFEEDEEDEVQ